MKTKFGIKEVVATGIGTALFVVLTTVQIPLGFIPIMGLLGHALGDALFYGSVWWSWVFPDALFGIVIGAFAVHFSIKEGGFAKKEAIRFNVIQVIANALAWIVVAPLLDILIYAEPANKVFTQGFFAFLEHFWHLVMPKLVVSLPACQKKIRNKHIWNRL